MHAVFRTTVHRVVFLGFQNGLRDSRISTNVFPRDLRTFCGRSSTLNDRRTFQDYCPSNCEQTLRVEPFMRSPELMTTMRRPRRLFKIRKSTACDNRIGLKHIPKNLTTANIRHRMCDTIGKFSLVRITSRAVNTKFIVSSQ